MKALVFDHVRPSKELLTRLRHVANYKAAFDTILAELSKQVKHKFPPKVKRYESLEVPAMTLYDVHFRACDSYFEVAWQDRERQGSFQVSEVRQEAGLPHAPPTASLPLTTTRRFTRVLAAERASGVKDNTRINVVGVKVSLNNETFKYPVSN